MNIWNDLPFSRMPCKKFSLYVWLLQKQLSSKAKSFVQWVNTFVESVVPWIYTAYVVSTVRLAWWRMSARIQVRRQSHSFTSSSAARVQRVTASTPLDSPTCLRRSSSQATEKPESLRGAPSASDSSSKFYYIPWLPSRLIKLWTGLSVSSCRKICQFAEDASVGSEHFASLVQLLNSI